MDVFYRGDMKSMPDGGGGGEEVVEKSARQRLESTESKNGSKLNGNDSSRSGKHLRMISNWSRSSNKKRRRASTVSSGSSSEEEDTDWSTSVGPSSDSDDDDVRKSRKRRRSALKKSGLRSSDESSSDDSSSESEDISRKHKSSGSRGKKSGRRKERTGSKVKSKERRSHRSGNSRDRDIESVSKKTKDRTKSRDKVESRHKDRRSKHRKEEGKKNSKDKVEEVAPSPQEGFIISKISRTPLQEKMDAQEKQKALIRHNAEMAKARLASGDMQRAREEQAEMQRLYGAVDWRARKKLRSEKKRLERTIAAGNKLANIEEREIARMDAFRVALGLPTAEAQRQAEWRAEATRALAEQEATMRETPASLLSAKPIKHSVIGPRLPH